MPEDDQILETSLGEFVTLAEAKLTEAATAKLKLIQPGWGSSGYYSPSLLQSAASVFRKGLQMFWDHQTSAEESAKPEGSLDRLAAVLESDAQWEQNGAQGPGLYATAKVFDRYRGALREMAPHIGVSIRASGMAKTGEVEGRKGAIIERITSAKSVDFVTVPGAGGRILSLFESAGRSAAAIKPHEEQNMNAEEIKALIAAETAPLRESITAAESKLAAAETKVTALETDNTRLKETIATQNATIALQGAGEFVRRKLAAVEGLPAVAVKRLQESLAGKATIKDGRLDEAALTAVVDAAVADEAKYLESIGLRTTVKGMGATTTTETKPEDVAKSLTESLKRLGGLSDEAAAKAAGGRFVA